MEDSLNGVQDSLNSGSGGVADSRPAPSMVNDFGTDLGQFMGETMVSVYKAVAITIVLLIIFKITKNPIV